LSDIAVNLLLPFVAGQASRPLLAGVLLRHRTIVGRVDRAVIVLIVYNAFCDSTLAGVWRGDALTLVVVVLGIDIFFLALALSAATWVSRRLGFDAADEAATVFCASKKSVINGVPMAKLVFGGGHALGLILLPVMVYHQLQLIVCAVLARRYAAAAAQLTGANRA
jgi:sodium/bile acid cotransporter 7